MTQASTQEVFSAQVVEVLESADVIEVLLLTTPVRYRLDKYRHKLKTQLHEARKSGSQVRVLVDWECQELLDLL